MQNTLLTPKTLAETFGIGVGKAYELMRSKDFPSVKLGGSWLVHPDAANAYFMVKRESM